MSKAKPVTYTDGTQAQKGDRVILSANVRHAEYAGLVGKVRWPVKSRNMITVAVTLQGYERYYDARPENVELVHEAADDLPPVPLEEMPDFNAHLQVEPCASCGDSAPVGDMVGSICKPCWRAQRPPQPTTDTELESQAQATLF